MLTLPDRQLTSDKISQNRSHYRNDNRPDNTLVEVLTRILL
nr:MAG TPA: hypothetical protein [Caudoviricetes sp.]